MQYSPDQIPVIFAIGEQTFRPVSLAESMDPVSLMSRAIDAAEDDCGVAFAADADSIDVVSQYSWHYRDAGQALVDQRGIAPKRVYYAPAGGESPIRLIHEAAIRISRGESRVAIVVGGESQHSVTAAERSGFTLPWPPREEELQPRLSAEDIFLPISLKYGLVQPVILYPFYENAAAAAWYQSPREALAESGELWSGYSEVAVRNPYSWAHEALSPETITTPTADNRIIAWPYTKRMVANPSVNQSAAVGIASLAWARAHGIPEDRLVYIVDGVAAIEPRDILQRDQFCSSHAQDVVLEEIARAAGPEGFAHQELYSCFPIVPKLARRRLGLAPDAEMTVTGGLPYFGAPLNNYMTHAACAMVRKLRADGERGLLYGQGEFLTKHHALLLSARPMDSLPRADYNLTSIADARRGPCPSLVENVTGEARIETFTVVHGRDGAPAMGIVILITSDGCRTLAHVPASDVDMMARLESLAVSPIGLTGQIKLVDGLQIFGR